MAKTTQMESPNDLLKSPSLKPTIGGGFNGIKGPDLMKRTSSPNSQDEKLYEDQSDAPINKTGA